MKALLIQHERAGDRSTSRDALSAAIKEAGWEVAFLTRKNADADSIAGARADLIVAAGGDGTVADVMKALPDRSVPLAIIPTGTANDIARSLGICGDPRDIIDGWDMDRRQLLDLGNARCPWGCRAFAEGVGFGAFADSLRRAPHVNGPRKLETGRAALREAVREAVSLPLDFTLDGAALPRDLLMVEILNVPVTGPRLTLAPGAVPGDGKLHVSFLPAKRRGAMIRWLEKNAGDPPVEQMSGAEVRVSGGGAMMRIDDECCWLKPGSEATIRLEGEPIQILAPADAPAPAG